MFKKKNEKTKYEIEAENLAVPEVHTGKIKPKDEEQENTDEPIIYEDLAIPEIHIKKKKP